MLAASHSKMTFGSECRNAYCLFIAKTKKQTEYRVFQLGPDHLGVACQIHVRQPRLALFTTYARLFNGTPQSAFSLTCVHSARYCVFQPALLQNVANEQMMEWDIDKTLRWWCRAAIVSGAMRLQSEVAQDL